MRVDPMIRQRRRGWKLFQTGAQIVPDLQATTVITRKKLIMTKLLSSLILAAVAMIGFNAQAASHAGAAPMKASEPAAKPAAAAEPAKKASAATKAKKAKKAKKAASAA
jgi:hypothetical protein